MKKIVLVLMCTSIAFAQAQTEDRNTTAHKVGSAMGTATGTVAFVATAIITLPLQLLGVVKVGNPFKDKDDKMSEDKISQEESNNDE
ncbi:MAG: hypothetical protein PHE78_08575 [Candidatus Gastranaerophilales bacterium]|nr:hypothetical protein [Candidatus Gastranaerophilales bacterium]